MKDIYSNLGVATVIAPDAYDDDNTPAALDLREFRSALLAISVGVGGITFSDTNKIEFKLTHSDDNASYEAVTGADVQGVENVGTGGIILALTSEHAAAATYKFGYVGGKRYLKLLADFGGSHEEPTPISAVAVLGHPHMAPVG